MTIWSSLVAQWVLSLTGQSSRVSQSCLRSRIVKLHRLGLILQLNLYSNA